MGADQEKPQKKLLNYLLFGSLGYYLIENKNGKIQQKVENLTSIPNLNQLKTVQNQSVIMNKELAKSAENLNQISNSSSKEISLDDLLFELVQETNKVTISQVIVQFLKINTKLEKTNLVINIVVSIVNICFFNVK